MDANLQEIINNLGEKTPRSRLGPYRELILELRRRNRTYREILQILADQCQIRVSISTLHDFLGARRRTDLKMKKHQTKEQDPPDLNEKPRRLASIKENIPDRNDVQQRIADLKRRPVTTKAESQLFNYDPDKPLHLPFKKKVDG
jgi:IS30 family transposase